MASDILLVSFHHILIATSILLTFTTPSIITITTAQSLKAPAIFVFGDSTVDPGNNNYILTAFKSNFPPYGHDFQGSKPTGRFTDGRLVTDFISSYAGIKDYIPPFLDPTLSIGQLKTGVSFASAGTGFDPFTAKISNVITIPKQMDHFREYRSKMEGALGKAETDHIIDNSLFVISAGTNDFGLNYFLLPDQRSRYNVSEYQKFILTNLKQLIQELRNEGAKKIGVVGLPPIGCVPALVTVFSKDKFGKRECIESFSSIARDYNEMLKNELSSKDYQSEGFMIIYADIYTPLNQIFQNPMKFGFEEVLKGCCGTGVLEASFLCNPASVLCPDVAKYAFFDSIHPTEKAYRILFESIRPLVDTLLK